VSVAAQQLVANVQDEVDLIAQGRALVTIFGGTHSTQVPDDVHLSVDGHVHRGRADHFGVFACGVLHNRYYFDAKRLGRCLIIKLLLLLFKNIFILFETIIKNVNMKLALLKYLQFFQMRVTLIFGRAGLTGTLAKLASNSRAAGPISAIVECVKVLTSIVYRSLQAFFKANKA